MIKLFFLADGQFLPQLFKMVCCNDDHDNQPFFVSVTLYMCEHVCEGSSKSHKIWAVRKIEWYTLLLL